MNDPFALTDELLKKHINWTPLTNQQMYALPAPELDRMYRYHETLSSACESFRADRRFDALIAPAFYDQGLGSYIDIFCVKPGERGWCLRGQVASRVGMAHGITVYISYVDPLYAWGADTRPLTRPYGPSLKPESVGMTPEGDWGEITGAIDEILTGHGLRPLRRDDLIKPLPFEAEIATLFKTGPTYTVFDALFWWSD